MQDIGCKLSYARILFSKTYELIHIAWRLCSFAHPYSRRTAYGTAPCLSCCFNRHPQTPVCFQSRFLFCIVAIISAPAPFFRLCNFAIYFSCRKNAYGTTKIFFHLSKGKTIHGYALKIYPITFSAEKSGVLFPEKSKIYKVFKNCREIPAKNRQRTVRSSAYCSIYFRNRNRITLSRFRLFCFVTVLIPLSAHTLPSSANRNPIMNACSSCLSETSASAFSNGSSRTFCCSVRVALSSVSSRTTVSSNSPLSVPFDTVCSCRSMLP